MGGRVGLGWTQNTVPGILTCRGEASEVHEWRQDREWSDVITAQSTGYLGTRGRHSSR